MKRTINVFALIAFACTAFAFAGCATDEGDDNADDDLQTSSTEQDLSSNEKAAFNYFVDRGLTKKQSAGIVGNLIQESSVRPTAVEFGGGPGRGIAQWSVNGRWRNLISYAATHHESRWTLHTQLAFTWHELKTVSGYGLSAIKKSKTVKAATIAFERDFEKCGNCQEAKRYSYAKQVYAAFSGSARIEEADEEDTDDLLPLDEDLEDAE